MHITIEKLKDAIVDATEALSVNSPTNTVTIGKTDYKLKNAFLFGSITKEIKATSLEVKKSNSKTKFTFINNAGLVESFFITHSVGSSVEVIENK